jgi:hypothetical protein
MTAILVIIVVVSASATTTAIASAASAVVISVIIPAEPAPTTSTAAAALGLVVVVVVRLERGKPKADQQFGGGLVGTGIHRLGPGVAAQPDRRRRSACPVRDHGARFQFPILDRAIKAEYYAGPFDRDSSAPASLDYQRFGQAAAGGAPLLVAGHSDQLQDLAIAREGEITAAAGSEDWKEKNSGQPGGKMLGTHGSPSV